MEWIIGILIVWLVLRIIGRVLLEFVVFIELALYGTPRAVTLKRELGE